MTSPYGTFGGPPVDLRCLQRDAERNTMRDTLGCAIRMLTPLAATSVDYGRALEHVATALRCFNEACAHENESTEPAPLPAGHYLK